MSFADIKSVEEAIPNIVVTGDVVYCFVIVHFEDVMVPRVILFISIKSVFNREQKEVSIRTYSSSDISALPLSIISPINIVVSGCSLDTAFQLFLRFKSVNISLSHERV